ncbi:MAG: hypothetical protein LBL72_08540 [Candidatus Accumulibacter sp.]|jgi:hypothetical protein|nr:hypothetical protein [Accumulibacter sp.]
MDDEANTIDRVIWLSDFVKMMGVCDETVRRWRKKNMLPEPDIALSRKTRGWRISTLRAAGINLP